MRSSDDARGVAAGGVVAAAFKLHMTSGFCRRRCREESYEGSHFTLGLTWKNCQGRHFSNDAAQGRILVQVRRALVLGVLDSLNGAAADDGAHF